MSSHTRFLLSLMIAAMLFGIDLASLKAQVVPSSAILKILKRTHDRPIPDKYILDGYEFDGLGKKVLVFGTNHGIRNPVDSMFTHMEEEFRKLSPDIVFTEAISSYLHPTRDLNIQLGGDMAFPRYLASKKGIEAYIWDLDQGEMYNFLRKEFSREDLCLFWYCLKLRGLVITDNQQVNSIIELKARELSLMGIPMSEKDWNPEYIKSLFRNRFNLEYDSKLSQKDWQEIDKQFIHGPLAKIKSKLFQLRDRRLLMTIGLFAQTHDRIFIQAGAMHKELMKKVLPSYMESLVDQKPQKQIDKINSVVDELAVQPYRSRLKVGNKELFLWASATSKTPQKEELSRELLVFKPSAILIEDFPEHYAILEDNIKYAGEPGLIRHIGAQHDLPVYNWASQTTRSLHQLSKRYKREEVCSAITFYYLQKYEQVFDNFRTYDDFWNVMSARLLCSNTMFTDYEASVGRFSEYALNYGFLSETQSHEANIDFDKLRLAMKHPGLESISNDLELLKANELLNSVIKQLQTNDRVFVHAPLKLIKLVEKSILAR
jgi:hypothetical protein